MKTTIEIADPLLRKAKQRAARDGTTLRALMERALEDHLTKTPLQPPYRLEIKPFYGNGLTEEFKNATPDQWLEAMYGEAPGFDRD